MRTCAICHEPFTPVGYWSFTYSGKIEVWVTVKLDSAPVMICHSCLTGVITRSVDDPLPRDVSGRVRSGEVEMPRIHVNSDEVS